MSTEALRLALAHISLCSQSSMSSKEECGRIARAALAQPSTERKPLTDEQIAAIGKRMLGIQFGNTDVDFARAIEREVMAERDAALEAAAKVCESVNNHDNPMTARDCSDAIRVLKGRT